MKMLSLLAVVLSLGLTLSAGEAEAAKRLGAGKSAGMQRQMDAPKAPPAAAPAQAPSAAAAKAPAAAPAAAAAQPKRSWMGPLAGLAAGLGLAALASHFGFGEELASMLMIALLVFAVIAVIGFVMRRKAAAQQPAAMPYAAGGAGDGVRPYEVAMPPAATAAAAGSASAPGRIPADFDVAAFVRTAKVNYIRLQAANDAGNLNDLREFTTPEMFAELKMNLSERGGAAQETDVVAIEADVLEVAEEESRYVVSVRFTGSIREERNGPVEPVDEVWHLVKPRDGSGGWLLAGIQQLQ